MRAREFWEQVGEGRRLIATYPGMWMQVADEVWDEDGVCICRCQTTWAASLIAVAHNLFLPMSNAMLVSRQKADDREMMRRD